MFSSLFHRITFSDLDPKNNFDLVCGCRLWSFESPYYNSAILDFDANDFDLIDLTQMIMIWSVDFASNFFSSILDLDPNDFTGCGAAEESEPHAPPGTHFQGAYHGGCFIITSKCLQHHHRHNPQHQHQHQHQHILLQKLQFQLAFLTAELEAIIREIFNEDVRGE